MNMFPPTTKVVLLFATFVLAMSSGLLLSGCKQDTAVMSFEEYREARKFLYPEGVNQDEFEHKYFQFVAPYYERAINKMQNAENQNDCLVGMVEGYRGPTNAMVELIRTVDDFDSFSHICEYEREKLRKQETLLPQYENFWWAGDLCFEKFHWGKPGNPVLRQEDIVRVLAEAMPKQAEVVKLVYAKYGGDFRQRIKIAFENPSKKFLLKWKPHFHLIHRTRRKDERLSSDLYGDVMKRVIFPASDLHPDDDKFYEHKNQNELSPDSPGRIEPVKSEFGFVSSD